MSGEISQSEEQQRLISMFESIEEEAKSRNFERLQNGENILDLTEFEDVKVEVNEFPQQDGSTRKVRRLVVTRKGKELPLLLPISIYETLKKYIQRGIMKVSVIKEGSGINTKYTVVPYVEVKK